MHYHTDSNNQYREEGFRVTYRSIGQWSIDSQLVFMYLVTICAQLVYTLGVYLLGLAGRAYLFVYVHPHLSCAKKLHYIHGCHATLL